MDRARLLQGLGVAVRSRRREQGLTRRALSERAQVSERFLVQLEGGEGNISVARLEDVAQALGTTGATLLQLGEAEASARAVAPPPARAVALVGLRGAGKSTVGARAAAELGVPFVELDALVAREAGMELSALFEMHGEAYFRRLQGEVLRRVLDDADRGRPVVLATGGSLVTDGESYGLLRRRAVTVWLKATPRDHWDRVVAQGDVRPMKNRENAMSELKTLLRGRQPLYAKAAHVVDTSKVSADEATRRVVAASRLTASPAGHPVSKRIGAKKAGTR